MEKEKYLRGLFAVFVFMVGYYLMQLLSPVSIPEPEKSMITSAKTGEPLSKEEVDIMAQKQEKARVAYTLTGKVTVKLRDSLQVEMSVGGQTRLLQLRFSPKMVFLEEAPLGGYGKDSSATEEREISSVGVKVGDVITVVFPKGITLDLISKTESIEVDNLIVNMTQREDLGKD